MSECACLLALLFVCDVYPAVGALLFARPLHQPANQPTASVFLCAGICGADGRGAGRPLPAPPLPLLHAGGAGGGVRAGEATRRCLCFLAPVFQSFPSPPLCLREVRQPHRGRARQGSGSGRSGTCRRGVRAGQVGWCLGAGWAGCAPRPRPPADRHHPGEVQEQNKRDAGFHQLPCASHPPPTPLPPQFLESYKSVTLASMAATFGVSPAFLDAELVRCVACPPAGPLEADCAV